MEGDREGETEKTHEYHGRLVRESFQQMDLELLAKKAVDTAQALVI